MTTPTIPFYPVTHDDGVNIVAAINDITRNLETPSLIADEFSSSKVYNIGDYVVYQGDLYRFTTAHSSTTWDENHVEQVKVGDELKSKVNQAELESIIQESAFEVKESGGLWYLDWFGAVNINPYSVTLEGANYVLYFNY